MKQKAHGANRYPKKLSRNIQARVNVMIIQASILL